MCIEGPYYSDLGASSNSDQKCLFVAGGVGLTGLSEVLYRRHCRGQSILLVWILRTIEEMEFLAKDLLDRLQPPRDTTRIMVFITRQKEHQEYPRRAQNAVVDHAPLLQTGCSELLDEDDEATGSTMTFPITVDEMPSYPSMRTMALVSLLGVALSFLLARMACCNRTVSDIESGRILHTCSAVPRASTSTTCSNSCKGEEDGATCCTTSICFYCFRGLPVVFMFFLAPFLSFLFVWMYPYGLDAMRCLSTYIETRGAISRFGNYTIPLHLRVARPAVPALEDAFHNPVTCGHEINYTLAVKGDPSHRYAPAVTNLNHTTIEYRKPVLSQIVEDFCASICSRPESHDFAMTNSISDIENDADDSTKTEEAAVFVCGSKNLAESLSHEVEIHNDNGDRTKPPHGAPEPNRRVCLSVWTATGAY